MQFDLSGRHGIPPDLSYLPQKEEMPSQEELREVSAACIGQLKTGLSCDLSNTNLIEERLDLYKRAAYMRQLRLRVPVPTIGRGVITFLISLAMMTTVVTFSVLYVVSSTCGCVAVAVSFLGLLPTDKKALPLLGIFVLIPIGFLYAFWLSMQAFEYWQELSNQACKFEDVVTPCWFIRVFFVSRVLEIVPCIVTTGRWMIVLKARIPSGVLLSNYTFHLGSNMAFSGITSIPKSIAACVAASVSLALGIFLAGISWVIGGGMLLVQNELHAKIQSWFMSRSESALMAAGVAELLCGTTNNTLLASARSNFKFIRADRVTFESMDNNHPDPKLAALTESGRLGLVDAFLSHSWHDDSNLKWIALQELREEFKAKKGREPTLWIDKFSIDQSNIELSLPSLPIYLAGCRQMWIICGRTYLERLWCIVEIFVFLEMGGLLLNLRVKLLTDVSRRLHSDLEAAASDLRPSKMTVFSLQLDAFDPRKARCFTDSDTERLQAVIETTGCEKITDLVKEVFT